MTMTTTDPGVSTGTTTTTTESAPATDSGIDALRAGIGDTTNPEGTGAEQKPVDGDKPDEIDAELDAWSKGEPATTTTQPAASDPLGGLSPDHPFVQAVMRQAREGEFNKSLTQAAQELVQAGVPRQALPAFMDVLRAAKQVADENTNLKQTLGKVDNSELVKTAKAQQLAKRYGRYGVTSESLMVGVKDKNYSAADMERLARSLAVINRQNGVKTRAANGSDRLESSRGQGGARSDIMDMTKPGLDLLRQGVK